MKNTIIFLLILIGMPWAHSQSAIEFGSDAYFIVDDWAFDSSNAPNIEWYHNYYESNIYKNDVSNDVENEYVFWTPELIKVYSSNEIGYEDFIVYEDTVLNRVMTVPLVFYDSISAKSVLLYDFNLEVGDTIQSPLFNIYNSCPQVITQIDTLVYEGISRKRFLFGCDNDFIVEGIGTSSGWITNLRHGVESGQNLKCVMTDGVLLYSNGGCQFNAVNEINKDVVRISPNPFQDKIQVQFLENIDGFITILNLQGKLCYQEPINSLASKLNLSSLMTGVYILNLSNNKGEVVAYQKIVKQ